MLYFKKYSKYKELPSDMVVELPSDLLYFKKYSKSKELPTDMLFISKIF